MNEKLKFSMDDKRYYSTNEAAKALNVSKSTLLRWFRHGEIKDVRRDRRGWRQFTMDDIEAIRQYIESVPEETTKS